MTQYITIIALLVSPAASSADPDDDDVVLSGSWETRVADNEGDAEYLEEEVIGDDLPHDENFENQTSDEGPIQPPQDGFAYPYSYENLFRGFDGGDCHHQGLDIGGVGENYGVGTPIYAIVDAEVVLIALPEDNPKKYGKRDRRKGKERRGDHLIPRRVEVDGYGTVYPFTRRNGSSRTGTYVVTRALHPDIEGYSVRYLHLAAVNPDIEVGDAVEAGQEIGLMGGTGFDETPPHLHLDMEDLDGVRVDPAPFIGLAEVRPSKCKPINKRKSKKKRRRIRYRVKKGDTLSQIAKRYKGVSVQDLIKWNHIDDPDSLRRGQKLKIYRR